MRQLAIFMCVLGPCWGAAAQDTQDEGVSVTLAAAGGTTQRVIDFESTSGPYHLNTGWVPALGMKLKVATELEPILLAFSVHYLTSVNAVGSQYAPDPDSEHVLTPIRSHRLEGGSTAAVRFGDVLAGVFVGYGLRALGSVGDLQVPRFTLHGPLVRLELKIPLLPELLWLRVAPEAQLIAYITTALTREAAIDSYGYSLGGEASLGLQVVERFALRLEYREAHAFAHSAVRDAFKDVERYLLLEARLLF
jgi:hypothetical protein